MSALRDATPTVASVDELGAHLRATSSTQDRPPVELFVDARLADSPIARATRAALHAEVRLHLVHGDSQPDDVEQTAAQARPGATVVGVGGGAAMDRAKLVALVMGEPARMRFLTSERRCGFLVLPEGVRRAAPLALVPTTVGTGAEASRTACLRRTDRKRLVYGEALRPDVAALDPIATATLPHWQLMEGVLEALLRVTSYYVGHHGERVDADAAGEQVVASLVEAGYAAAAHGGSGQACPAPLRRRIAELSSQTQSPRLQQGLRPFSDKCWPLANELAVASGARKLTALASVTPEVWRRVSTGQVAWGSAGRLDRLWAIIRDVAPRPLPDEAATGLTHLVTDWAVSTQVSRVDIDRLAETAASAWARGLPMLGGVSESEVRSVYSAALCGPVLSESTQRGR